MSVQRLDILKAALASYKAVSNLEHYVQSSLSRADIHLIKLRASQINGCAFCVDKHVKEARRDGMGEQWINLICAWRESTVYSARERALLGWVETLTHLATTGAPDADFAALQAHFTHEEIANVTVAIGTINLWNMIAVGFRFQHPVDAPQQAA
ncbi:carboxymuconolactone decarboxylase family protein [Rhizobium sp.]|jgi:AhpD family alkylhydroperoxidase|uniref:carboxymuconolactone decarboxylase family protein n=1 Tax=Rhizobium sp. TaxID=391 RepID=UPI000E9D0C49|nr:alkylhydroperoxidase [Rhizobium sp.]